VKPILIYIFRLTGHETEADKWIVLIEGREPKAVPGHARLFLDSENGIADRSLAPRLR
jgi:hypothetical protein